jgi:hypothetical protein
LSDHRHIVPRADRTIQPTERHDMIAPVAWQAGRGRQQGPDERAVMIQIVIRLTFEIFVSVINKSIPEAETDRQWASYYL